MHNSIITEGLQGNDLKGFVSELLTIDRYKSKMGDDSDVIVIGFKVKEKFPAIDLMEFIEKGYNFVLDSDISSGEEYDGKYHVFVEIERSKSFPGQLQDLLNGVSKLTDCHEWKFNYQTSTKIVEITKENIRIMIDNGYHINHTKDIAFLMTTIKSILLRYDQIEYPIQTIIDEQLTFLKDEEVYNEEE